MWIPTILIPIGIIFDTSCIYSVVLSKMSADLTGRANYKEIEGVGEERES